MLRILQPWNDIVNEKKEEYLRRKEEYEGNSPAASPAVVAAEEPKDAKKRVRKAEAVADIPVEEPKKGKKVCCTVTRSFITPHQLTDDLIQPSRLRRRPRRRPLLPRCVSVSRMRSSASARSKLEKYHRDNPMLMQSVLQSESDDDDSSSSDSVSDEGDTSSEEEASPPPKKVKKDKKTSKK